MGPIMGLIITGWILVLCSASCMVSLWFIVAHLGNIYRALERLFEQEKQSQR